MLRNTNLFVQRFLPNAIRVFLGTVALIPYCGAAGSTSPTKAMNWPSSPIPGTGQFAVADFDGDSLPDIASVQVDQSAGHGARYRIQFSLSTGLQQVVSVMGPVGGLQIATQDVNGDEFLDLVVRSPWQEQPVAVLLNDGHGNFDAVQPASFPQIDWKSQSSQFVRLIQVTYPEVASLTRTRHKVHQPASGRSVATFATDTLGNLDSTVPPIPESITQNGRAPPVILH